MKKYKVIKSFPGIKIGQTYSENGLGFICFNSKFYPDQWAEYFQEIPEQSDEEFLAKWLCATFNKVDYNLNWDFSNSWNDLAKTLIANGFDVKKLRES